jgi:aldehyde dehydrogenase (NAD+)
VTDTAVLARYRLYIDGAEVESAAGATFASINPATGEAWAQFEDASADDVDRAVTAAAAAFAQGSPWRSLSATKRGRLMFRLADLIREHAERIAAIEVRENGKADAGDARATRRGTGLAHLLRRAGRQDRGPHDPA